MKITLDDIQSVLQENKIPAQTITKIVEELKNVEEENKPTAGIKQKNKFLVVLQGDKSLHDKIQVAHLVQVKEDYDPVNLPNDIETAKNAHNSSQKRKKNPLSSLNDVFCRIKSKFTVAQNWKNKSKQPIQIVWF